MVAPFERDLRTPASFERAIDEQHERRAGREKRRAEQMQQDTAQVYWRPHGPIEHAMVCREMALPAQTDRTQGSGHGTPARGEQCARDQELHMFEGWACEGNRKGGEQSAKALRHWQQINLP